MLWYVETAHYSIEKLKIKRERKISDEIVENANGLMPDGTQWPHDQHNVSNDDCLGSLSERIRFVQYRVSSKL